MEESSAELPEGPHALAAMAPAMAPADILGLSCRFPESGNASEFWSNLVAGRDMVTSDDRRWPVGLHGTPPRSGKVPDYEKFDASFFAVHGKQAQKMDPQMRKLLEVSWEAWMDAGVDVNKLRGSERVGVYIGCCGSEVHAAWLADVPNITGYEQTGCTQSMFANRLSWTYDFRGPSKAVDTACSSSALALHDAIADLTAGRCDYAMVGGASSILRPATSVAFNKLHMLSPDGACKSFSAAANGYTRADGIAMLILRRSDVTSTPRWAAREPYAQVVNIGTNNDGHTKEGITFPSSHAQGSLARQVCRTAGVQPSQVGYVEAHGTGTVAGDGQELGAIDAWYGRAAGRNAESPLLIGSVKSNMGHCEGASGLAGVIKLCLSYEHGILPGNLHYQEPNPNCASLHDGTLKVVDATTAWTGGHAALSSFGFGGSNVHMLLHGRPRSRSVISLTANDASSVPVSPRPAAAEPQPTGPDAIGDLIPLAARTSEGMAALITAIQESKVTSAALMKPLRRLANTVARDVSKFSCRGVLSGGEARSATAPAQAPQVWFVFSGNGGQWSQMGLTLLRSHVAFRASIEASAAILSELGLDLVAEFEDENGFKDPARSAVGLCAIQIALVDILREDHGIVPDGMLGHSAGEIACGYASGCLTQEQTLLVAYHRGRLPVAHSLKGGLMAATGLSAADALARLEGSRVVLACDNSPVSTTISGPAADVLSIIETLKEEGIFAREVETLGLAFHSPALDPLLPELTQELRGAIPTAKERPATWISTSFPADSEDPAAKLCSAEYQVHSYRNRVLFTAAAAAVPKDAILVELGPHALLRSPLRQSRPELAYVSLMRKGECGAATLAAAISELWRKGASINWQTDAVPSGVKGAELPRSVREALTSWDHRLDYPMPKMSGSSSAGAFSKTYELGGEHAFLADHKIDGRILMPATSYLVTAWDALANQMDKPSSEVPVEWSDVSIHQAVQADPDSSVTLSVLLDRSNRFQVLSGTDLIAEGKIKARAVPPAQPAEAPEAAQQPTWPFEPAATVDAAAFYKDVARTGISYGPCFRMVQQASVDATIAFMRWDGCFIRFLDGMLQTSALGSTDYQLRIPVRLRHVAILDAAPIIPVEGPVRVDVDHVCGTAHTPLCEVAGIELSIAPTRPANSRTVVSRFAWVPYGERTSGDSNRAQYARQLCALAKSLLLPLLSKTDDLPGHLVKVKQLLEQLPGQDLTEQEQQEIAAQDSSQLAKALLEACNGATEATAVEDIAAALSDHAGLAAAYEKDALLSGFGLAELKIMLDIAMENQRPEGFTVCEVCAGSGGLTKQAEVEHCLQALGELNSNPVTDLLRYTATDLRDISDSLPKALPSPKLSCQVWDINEPAPASMGGPFDLILASHGVYEARDLGASLAHIGNALAPGGFLLFQELVSPLAACLWGLTAAAWECSGGRTFGRWSDARHWTELCEAAGFAAVSMLRCPEGSSAMFLFRKVETRVMPAIKLPATPLLASDEEMDAWMADYQAALDRTEPSAEPAADPAIPEQPGNTAKGRVWIHGDVATAPGLLGFVRSARKEPRGEVLRCVFSAGASSSQPAELVDASRKLDLLMNMFMDGRHGSYRNILTQHDVGVDEGASKAGCHLAFASYGDLSSLTWVENKPSPNNLEQCDVSYGALNFRDVMLAYGKLSRDLMAHGNGGDYIGLEFSGHTTAGGRRVMGVAKNAIATQVSTPHYLLWDMPPAWSLAEAATVPVAYATAYYALVLRGRLRQGFGVLIHSGSGAVGLAAIQICLNRGCEVFTTCGSAAKKQFLLDTFPGLKEGNIGDSRSCSFEALVMRATQGRGVRLILNSLADDKLQASVRCLGDRGRLLEIGKYDILKGAALSMRPLLRNIAFDGIDLDRVFNDADDTAEIVALHKLMGEGILSGEVRPLPLTIFTHARAEEAFRFLATGTHIGKCMIEMQHSEVEGTARNCLGARTKQPQAPESAGIAQAPEQIRPHPTFSCRDDRCYIVTGGLGGFGLALAQWLAQRGARHLLLTSKRGMRTGSQAKAIQQLRSQGVQVVVSKLDVSDLDETHQILQLGEGMAPVAGVFHLAMVLTDKWIANQTGKGWNAGVIPKAVGGRNLDVASRQLQHLEHFVMFSSIVASAGNEGQSNYGYANSALDFLCEARAAQGLPALSLQWGVIGHVGFVEEAMQGKLIGRLSEISLPQPVDDCLQVLGRLLCGGPGHGPVMGSYWQPSDLLGRSGADSDKDLVTAILDIMGLSADAVSDNDSLAAMGIDSMQLVEVRANIQRALGRPLPLEEIGTLTIGGLKALAAEAGCAAPAPTAAQPAAAASETARAAEEPASEEAEPTRRSPSAPGTPDKGESPRASSSSNALQASSPPEAVTVETEQTAEAAKAPLRKQVSRIEVSACCEAAAQPGGPATEAPADPEGRRRRLTWLAMTGAGFLLIGVLLVAAATPAFSLAATWASSFGVLAMLPVLPLLWLLFGCSLCLGTVVLKKLLMPVLEEGRPIAMWSADFARWWLVHRAIGMTNHLFARHLRGTAFLPAFFRALGARIGEHTFIDSLDLMDLDLVEIEDDVVIGEGTTVLGHSFEGGRLHFRKVHVGRDSELRPYSIVAAGSRLPSGSTLGPMASMPIEKSGAKQDALSTQLSGALGNLISSTEISATAAVALQVAGLYCVGLLVCCAAFVGYTAFALALCQVGVPAGFAFHPAGFAASAMVAMTSPLFLAFLPLMLPIELCLGSGALWQLAVATTACPVALAVCSISVVVLTACAKRSLIGTVPAAIHRRQSWFGIRFWLSQRLVDTGFTSMGSMLIGTWGASVFYRLYGAKVGKWTTFRFGNTILAPDMLDLGDWVHVGDTANVITSIALDSKRILTAPLTINSQALLGVSAVLLPGTVVGQGATLGALASPGMGSSLKPGLVYMGHPAHPVLRAQPSSSKGEVPATWAMRVAVAVFPLVQVFAALAFTQVSAAPAAAVAFLVSSAAQTGGTTALAAALVTAVYGLGLTVFGAAGKRSLVGRLAEASGIKKYSRHNLGRMLAWVLEMRANDLFGEAAKGSAWWNGVLRTRGVAIGKDVYIDTLWAGDYELMSYGDGAVVDHGATLFAHLGMYKHGELSMLQASASVESGAIVGARSAVLPGFRLESGQCLAPGKLGMPLKM